MLLGWRHKSISLTFQCSFSVSLFCHSDQGETKAVHQSCCSYIHWTSESAEALWNLVRSTLSLPACCWQMGGGSWKAKLDHFWLWSSLLYFHTVYVHVNRVGCECRETKIFFLKVYSLRQKGFCFNKFKFYMFQRLIFRCHWEKCWATFKLALLFHNILLEYKVN